MAQDFKVAGVLSLDDQMSGKLKAASAAVGNFTQKTQSMGSRVAAATKTIGTGMMAAGAATTAMGIKSVKSFGNFQASLNKAAVVAGGTSKDISGLADVANRMGAELPLSAQDSADAMIEMAAAGADVATIKKTFPAIAEAATATGEDLQDTASVVQNSMNIWGDSLKSPAKAAAILTKVANLSNAGISDMNQAIATIGGTAKNAGFGMQDMTTAIGLLTNKGFSAARASQDLNHAILAMQAPSKGAKAQMDALGLSFTDAQGNMKPFPTILSEIADSLDGMTSSQKAAALKKMFGSSGMAAILPLLDSIKDKSGNTAKSWDAFSASVDKASSSSATATKYLQDQASEMQQNVGSKIEQVGGNWEALSNKSMASKSKVTGGLLDMVNSTIEWATKSNDSIAQVIRGFVGLSPIIGPSLVAIGATTRNLVPIFGLLKTAGSGLGKVFMLMKTPIASLKTGFTALWGVIAANPIMAIIIAITAVTVALTLFFTKTKAGQQIVATVVQFIQTAWQNLATFLTTLFTGIGAFFSNIWNSVVVGLTPIIAAIQNLWNTLVQFIMMIWTPIAPFFQGLWTGITIIFSTVWNNIVVVIQTAWTVIQTVVSTGISIIQTVFGTGWNILVTIVSAAWSIISTVVSTAINAIASIISIIMDIIQGNWSGAWNEIEALASSIWSAIQSVITTYINAVSSVISSVLNAIQNIWNSVWNGIKSIAVSIWNAIQSVVTNNINAVKSVINSVLNGIKNIWTSVWNGIKSVAISIWNGIKSAITAAINAVRSVISSVLNGIKSIWTSAWNSLRSAVSSAWSGIRSTVQSGINSIKSIMNIGSALYSAGANAIRGFWNGLRSMFSSVISSVQSFASRVANTMRKVLKIHSPSRVTRGLGSYTGQGFVLGLKDQYASVQDMSARIAAAAIPDVNKNTLANNINGINKRMQSGISGTLNSNISLNQPAQINLSLGGSNYKAFVGDITQQQNVDLTIDKNYSL